MKSKVITSTTVQNVKAAPSTLIEGIKKARSLKTIHALLSSGKYVARNPKTLRRQRRVLKARLATLGIKTKVAIA